MTSKLRSTPRSPKGLLLLLISLSAGWFMSCQSGQQTNQPLIHFSDSIQREAGVLTQRIFFLLDAIEHNNAVKKALTGNTALTAYQQQKRDSLVSAVAHCPDMDCLVQALAISEAENTAIVTQLANSFRADTAVFKKFIAKKLRPSHAFFLDRALADSAFLLAAWQQQKKGINYIVHGYLQNKGIHYPSIDSTMFNVHDTAYLDTVKQTLNAVLAESKGSQLFFQPTLAMCIKILQLNHRNEAARFIPLKDVNQKAYAQLAQIKWKKYPFSSILIFGAGPSKAGVAIDPINKIRCRMGVALYKAKKAPFIIVSGGYVHPYQTPFNEAFQMKKFITDSLGVPDNVIIMEPHARHTTGNIRNANRILLRNGFPADKAVLGVTSASHITYIAGQNFQAACKRDFGLIPYTGLKKLSDTTVSYLPDSTSLQINAIAPLNP